MVQPILPFPTIERPLPPSIYPADQFAEAYKICAAIRALQAVRLLHAELGTVDRLEHDLKGRASHLRITVTDLWSKYDAFVLGQSRANAKLRIEQGQFDPAVVSRASRIKGNFNQHYPFHDKPESKSNVASITVYNGKVESVIFNLDHGLANGIYALKVSP